MATTIPDLDFLGYDTWDDDPDEAMCDALYHETPRGYLSPPRCLYFADHRDAANPDFHDDARGFRWPRTTTA